MFWDVTICKPGNRVQLVTATFFGLAILGKNEIGPLGMNFRPSTRQSVRSCLSMACFGVLGSLVILSLSCGIARDAWAADISREVRQGHEQTDGFLELGLNASIFRLPIVGLTDNEKDPEKGNFSLGLVINGMYEWRGFFAELLYDSFGGITLGYRALRSKNGSLELVVTNTLAELDPDTEGFETIQTRAPDAVVGLRSSWYLPNSIAQVSLLTDASDTHNGFTASAHWGRAWQVRNWNLHAMIGMRHFSKNVSDYYFGVSPEEVSDNTPLYSATSGTMAELDLGATVPINENWLFRSGLQAYRLPGSVVDSPLTSERVAYEISSGFFYVF